MMSVGGDMDMPECQYNNGGQLIFSGEKMKLYSLSNRDGGIVILTGKKVILEIKHIYGLERIDFKDVEDLTLIGTETPIDLSYLEHHAPNLSRLTVDSCKGLSNTRENLISCDHLLSKKISIYLINMSEFEEEYYKYLSSSKNPIGRSLASQADFIDTPTHDGRVVRTLTDEAITRNLQESMQLNLASGAIVQNPSENGPLFITVNPDRFVNQLCGYTLPPQSIPSSEQLNNSQSNPNSVNSLIGRGTTTDRI